MPKNSKKRQKYRNNIKDIIFGDIRNFDDVKKAVEQSEAVIHLAAIIPPTSKNNRQLTMAVNLGGTINLINAIKETQKDISLIFTSSVSVMGPTQLQDKWVNRRSYS